MKKNFSLLNLTQPTIILFWALWFTLVSLSDITNFLQVIHLLPTDFHFSSKNYDLVVNHLTTYDLHSLRLSLFLFGIIIIWATCIAIAFWTALFFIKNVNFSYFAFFLSLSLTATFILSDEVFINYSMEHGHIIRFMLQLVTFLFFYKNEA